MRFVVILSHCLRVCRAAAHSGHLDVAKLLLSRGACPNAAMADTGVTAVMLAAQTGRLAMVQLLSVYGADRTAVTTDGNGHTALSIATNLAGVPGKHPVALWLERVDGWSTIRISVGCRLVDEARFALAQGRIDPSHGGFQAVKLTCWTYIGVDPDRDAATMFPLTVRLAHDAMAAWSPSRHALYHTRFRAVVGTILLAAQRLAHLAGGVIPASAASVVTVLPAEMWRTVMTFLLRRHFRVDGGGIEGDVERPMQAEIEVEGDAVGELVGVVDMDIEMD